MSTVSERWHHCTFTNQLTKKSKVFRDGLLRVKTFVSSNQSINQKVDLFDESNRNISIDGQLLTQAIDVKDGEQLLFDRHIIDVGELAAGSSLQQSTYQPNPRPSDATLNKRVAQSTTQDQEEPYSISQSNNRSTALPAKAPLRRAFKPLHPVNAKQLALIAKRDGKPSPPELSPRSDSFSQTTSRTINQSNNRPDPFVILSQQSQQPSTFRPDPFARSKPSFDEDNSQNSQPISQPHSQSISQTIKQSNNQPFSQSFTQPFTGSRFGSSIKSVMDLDLSVFDNDDDYIDQLTQPNVSQTSQSSINRSTSSAASHQQVHDKPDQSVNRSTLHSINPFFDDLDTTPPTPPARLSFHASTPIRSTNQSINQIDTSSQSADKQSSRSPPFSTMSPAATNNQSINQPIKPTFAFIDDDDDDDDGVPLFTLNTSHSQSIKQSSNQPTASPIHFPSSFATLRSQSNKQSINQSNNQPDQAINQQRPPPLPSNRFQPPRPAGGAFSALSKTAVAWKPGGDKSNNIALGGSYPDDLSNSQSNNQSSNLITPSRSALCPIRFVSSSKPHKLSIPDRFPSIVAYQTTFIAALTEQINLMIEPTNKSFQDATTAWAERMKLSNSRIEDGKAMEKFFRSKNVSFYHRDHLEINSARSSQQQQSSPFKRFKGKGKWPTRTRKRGYDDDGDDDVDTPASPEKNEDDDVFWLSLSNQSSFEKSYSQHDLWIISNQPHFVSTSGQKPKGYGTAWIFFATSLFRGFSPQYQSMKVKALPVEGDHLPQLNKREKVYAIRSVELSNMLQMVNALKATSPTTLPLLPTLLHGDQASDADLKTSLTSRAGSFNKIIQSLNIPDSLIDEAHDSVVSTFKLNVDQIAVVDHCVKWIKQARGPLSAVDKFEPVLLVHGCFGSGKSKLLVALVIMLCHIFDAVDSQKRVRIMLAALTNVAVDNLLQGLLDHGYDQFARVGSAKRIAEPILAYTAHCSGGGKSAEQHDQHALKELQDKMSQAQKDGIDGVHRVELLRIAIAQLKKEHGIKRRRRLMTRRVVGVTCAACSFEVLDGAVFPIILLDECSQLIEPASLVPLQRFGCERLIAVGDPKQLPPTLLEVEGASSGGFSSLSSCLSKAMFERLAAAGVPMISLRHTYRMHPMLMALPNSQFYGSSLIDGITAADRPALFSKHIDGTPSVSLPPLLFINSGDGEEQRESAWGGGSGGSVFNPAEIRHVTNLVAALIRKGLPASSIGVITLYRAQAWRLKKEIARVLQEQHEKSLNAAQQVSERNNDILIFDQHLDDIVDRTHAERLKAGTPSVPPAPDLDNGIQVSTVDSFQGGEKDVIVLSCVRTAVSDFLENERRVNVAMTRARHHFFVIGKQGVLKSSRIWQACISQSMKTPGSFYNDSRLLVNSLNQSDLNNEFLRNRSLQQSQARDRPIRALDDGDLCQPCDLPATQVKSKRGVKRVLSKSPSNRSDTFEGDQTTSQQARLFEDDTTSDQMNTQLFDEDHSIESSLSSLTDDQSIDRELDEDEQFRINQSLDLNLMIDQPIDNDEAIDIHELLDPSTDPDASQETTINQPIKQSKKRINKRQVDDDDDEAEYDESNVPSHDELVAKIQEIQAQVDEEMMEEMDFLVDDDEV